MPHTCTRCNSVFDSGEDILKGCPVCGWKKFMFVRKQHKQEIGEKEPEERIITRAMGVRMPPKSVSNDEKKIAGAPGNCSLPSYKPAFEAAAGAASRVENSARDGKMLESIKITAPGTYELNLSSLFERGELIMAVKEGTYFIDLSSAFRKSKKD
jgi:predicted  nucleic acid-binding Zn-ribbon protein